MSTVEKRHGKNIFLIAFFLFRCIAVVLIQKVVHLIFRILILNKYDKKIFIIFPFQLKLSCHSFGCNNYHKYTKKISVILKEKN